MLRSAYSMAASTASSAAEVLQLEAEVALLRAAGYSYSQAASQATSQAPSRRPSSDSETAEAVAPSEAVPTYAPTSAPAYAETAPLPPPEVRKFKSGAEAAAAAHAAARAGAAPLVSAPGSEVSLLPVLAGAAPLVSAPGSEVSLLPIKYKSGREAALAALAEAQRRPAPGETPTTALVEAPVTAPAEEPPPSLV